MVLASEVKEGTAIELEGKVYKVLEAIRHAGSGQMQGFIELKLKDMRFGHFADRRFKHTDKLENVELTKRQMEYIYSDQEACYFMDPETFEQIGIPKVSIGHSEKFLKEGYKVTVELLGEEAVSIQLPKIVELKVASTGSGIREGQDNTMKPAVLENGLEIRVPQFVVTGDVVRIDTEKLKYIDRVGKKTI
ncbi:MAG: elongation factor P [Ignavibacteriae bacterium]|nr:elongation factor P [Ignavibacteriota bacterium]